MKKFAAGFLILMAFSAPALAQKKQSPVTVDPCAPIGKTSDGRLVYALKCDAIPVAVAPAPAAAVAPPPEEEDKGGLFRNPFPSIIRPTNVERNPGVGPAGSSR